MTSLTQTAHFSRKIIKYGALVFVSFLLLRSFFLSFRTYWKKIHPSPPPQPTVAFGKLPKLKFPQRENLPSLALKLETVSGSLPKLPNQAKVFFMPQSSISFNVWDKTKVWARSLGFAQEPEKKGDFDFRFETETFPKTILDVNVLTRNFALIYDWRGDLEILSQGNPPQETQAVSLAKGFLQNAGVLTNDLAQGKGEVTYFKYIEGNLVKSLFFSEANFARVNLFRQELEEIKVLPPNPQEANVSLLLSGSNNREKSIIEIKYIHFPISLTNFATYPLKETITAWSQLEKGKGFIANLGNNQSGKITIREAYLAYYESEESQNFLQPVIVFGGDNDFYAYVPAVSDSWLEQ